MSGSHSVLSGHIWHGMNTNKWDVAGYPLPTEKNLKRPTCCRLYIPAIGYMLEAIPGIMTEPCGGIIFTCPIIGPIIIPAGWITTININTELDFRILDNSLCIFANIPLRYTLGNILDPLLPRLYLRLWENPRWQLHNSFFSYIQHLEWTSYSSFIWLQPARKHLKHNLFSEAYQGHITPILSIGDIIPSTYQPSVHD